MSDRRVIWKHLLDSADTSIEMPEGADLVGFGHQDGQLVIWVRVDPEAAVTRRHFRVFGTGMEHEAGLTYRGLVQMPNGLVWHLLENVSGGAR